MKKKLFLLMILLMPVKSYIYPQFLHKKETRNIVISSNDSIFVCNVLKNIPQKTRKKDALYYWFKSNGIYKNQTDYTGKPLHGEFLVFDMYNRLLVKGFFKCGLKNGLWKEWDTDGNIIRISQWKNGKLNGKVIYYKSGKVYKTATYKKGYLHGKVCNFGKYKTSNSCKKYKNGKEIKPENKQKNDLHINIFKQKKS